VEYAFSKTGFKIVKSAISKELAQFCYEYLLLKKEVARQLFLHNIANPHQDVWGTFDDGNVPHTYSHYADVAMETLLTRLKPLVSKITKLKLIENYSYLRVYKYGDVLKRHQDRESCEISTTLNLGGDKLWPIYLKNHIREYEVLLSPGDMLIYEGCILEHWRKKFNGKNCVQVFFHYNNVRKTGYINQYDGRSALGLPSYAKNK
jgi:hypothetical protein